VTNIQPQIAEYACSGSELTPLFCPPASRRNGIPAWAFDVARISIHRQPRRSAARDWLMCANDPALGNSCALLTPVSGLAVRGFQGKIGRFPSEGPRSRGNPNGAVGRTYMLKSVAAVLVSASGYPPMFFMQTAIVSWSSLVGLNSTSSVPA
jgi:hypothetical protein